MRYVPVVMEQIDRDGNKVENGFVRYGIIDRAQNNRVIFSSRSEENNRTKLLAIMGIKEDDFDREEFNRKMKERKEALRGNDEILGVELTG